MDLFQILWEAFSLENKSIQELIELSMRIDTEKSKNGFYVNDKDDLSIIACAIVALLNEKSTLTIGEKLYTSVNELIVSKNTSFANERNGLRIYEETKSRENPGTYKIQKTRTGYKFDLVSANGEFLATSEIYSSLDSCTNGINSVQKNSHSPVEDQTEKDYKSLRNPKYEMYLDKAGEFRFRLKLMNGQVIIVSGGHKSKSECLKTIERIKESVHSNDIEKM